MTKKIETPEVPPLQSDAAAMTAIARVGAIAREIAGIEAECNTTVASATEGAATKAAPLRVEGDLLTESLRRYCEAERARLTDGGTTKTVLFATGAVSWRDRPASVKLRGKVADIIARLRRARLSRFIRTKHEIDKEAMLKEPGVAAKVQGVSIGSAGEDFFVEPLEATIAEAKS